MLPVQTVEAAATLDSEQVQLEDWSVSREIATDLPDQVRQTAGVAAAEATLQVAAPADADRGFFSPWKPGHLPSVGKPVDVDGIVDGVATRLFTGLVADENASATSPSRRLTCLDRAYEFRRPVTIPGVVDAPGTRWGLSPTWVIEHVGRQVGFTTVPPAMPDGDVVLSATFVGSTFPEVGNADVSNTAPEFVVRDNGVWSSSRGQGYRPPSPAVADIPELGGSDSGVINLTVGGRALRLMWMVWPGEFGYVDNFVAFVMDGITGFLGNVTVGQDGTVTGFVGDMSGSDDAVLGSVQPGELFAVDIERLDVDDWQFTLWSTAGGQQVLQTAASTGMEVFQLAVSRFELDPGTGWGHPFGPVQLGLVDPAIDPTLTWERTAFLDRAEAQIVAVPLAGQRAALTVLTDLADAEQGAIWVDRTGRLQFRNRTSARAAGQPATPIRARDSILDLEWQESIDQLRAGVDVPVVEPDLVHNDGDYVDVWSETRVRSVPGNGTLTFDVDLPDTVVAEVFRPMAQTTGGSPQSRFLTNTASDGSGSQLSGLDGTVTQLAPDRLRIQISNPNGQRAWLVDTNGDPYIHVAARAAAVFRGASSVVSTETLAATAVERLTLSTNPWRQSPDEAARLADFLAVQLSAPQPQVQTVEVVPDLDVDLGDVVAIIDPEVTQARFRGLVRGVRWEGGPGRLRQLLQVRPLVPTLADLDALWSGQDLADLDTHWSGQTLADVDADPIEIGD